MFSSSLSQTIFFALSRIEVYWKSVHAGGLLEIAAAAVIVAAAAAAYTGRKRIFRMPKTLCVTDTKYVLRRKGGIQL